MLILIIPEDIVVKTSPVEVFHNFTVASQEADNKRPDVSVIVFPELLVTCISSLFKIASEEIQPVCPLNVL